MSEKLSIQTRRILAYQISLQLLFYGIEISSTENRFLRLKNDAVTQSNHCKLLNSIDRKLLNSESISNFMGQFKGKKSGYWKKKHKNLREFYVWKNVAM